MAAKVRHSIIGTAGHIDHGKTALVKALTGQDTDRLKEEKERGISIELGFAYLTLPSGERVGVIDVPGHERFIRNMLAGAHGVDLALIVIAADDGVMPQSEEHLDILHLLGVQRAIFVISKTDLVDPERIREVRDEIELLAEGTRFEGAPVIPVSSITGHGLDELKAEIARQLEGLEHRQGLEIFRLPVDRAFVIKGHGTVVTGTALSGEVKVGQRLRILPANELVRVRSIQVHSVAVESAGFGQRVALNIAGPERIEIKRGDVIVDERLKFTSSRFDAFFEVRPMAKRPLKTNDKVHLFIGTSDTLGRVVVLEEGGQIPPKATGLIQLVLTQPVVALRGDRFIVRDASSQRTLGGGIVINPLARRVKGSSLDRYRRLLKVLHETRGEEALQALFELQDALAMDSEHIAQMINQPRAEVEKVLEGTAFIRIAAGEETAFMPRSKWETFKNLVVRAVTEYHKAQPLAPGLDMEELRSRVSADLAPRLFRVLIDRLAGETEIEREDNILRLRSHQVQLSGEDKELALRIERTLEQARFQPPDVRQLNASLGLSAEGAEKVTRLLGVLERQGKVIKVSKELYFSASSVREAQARLADYLRAHTEISAATFRDLLETSRKFAIALLDYFDRSGVTLRVGDLRRLRQTSAG